MTQVIDAEGRVKLPPEFRPGDAVELQVVDLGRVILSRAEQSQKAEAKIVTKPDGSSVITGLPKFDSETVYRLLEDFP